MLKLAIVGRSDLFQDKRKIEVNTEGIKTDSMRDDC